MLNVGFLMVQEKAQDKLNSLQMSPCWPYIISNFVVLFSALHFRQKNYFHVTSAEGSSPTFLPVSLIALPLGVGLSSDSLIIFVFGRVLQCRKCCLLTSILQPFPPSKPCKTAVGGGEQRGLCDHLTGMS